MQRRDFMRTSMGLATAFLASNMVYGPNWDVDAAETLEPAATEEKYPKGEYFVIDVQTHFTDSAAGPLMGFRSMEFVKNMGFHLKNDVDSYSFPNYVKEIFFDSETNMAVISGVPGKEINKDPKTGKILEGRAARPASPFCRAGRCQNRRSSSTIWPRASGPSAKATALPTITGTRKKTSPISTLCSSRWSAKSRSTASTVGSGTATPTRPGRAMASSWTTRRWPIPSTRNRAS